MTKRRGETEERKKFVTHWFTLRMPVTTGAETGQNQAAGILSWSSKWAQGPKHLSHVPLPYQMH